MQDFACAVHKRTINLNSTLVPHMPLRVGEIQMDLTRSSTSCASASLPSTGRSVVGQETSSHITHICTYLYETGTHASHMGWPTDYVIRVLHQQKKKHQLRPLGLMGLRETKPNRRRRKKRRQSTKQNERKERPNGRLRKMPSKCLPWSMSKRQTAPVVH